MCFGAMNSHGISSLVLIVLVANFANTFTITKDDIADSRIPRSVKYNLKDPLVFIKEVDDELKTLIETIPTSFDQQIDPEDNNELTLLNTFSKIGKELKQISLGARSFDVNTIEDPNVNHTLSQLKSFGGMFKLGYETIHFVNLIVYVKERYSTEYMQSSDDSDVYYSVSDLDYLQDFLDIDTLKYLYRDYYKVFEDEVEKFYKAVELIQAASEEYEVSPAQFWYSYYSEDVLCEIEKVMTDLKPFYQLLHAEIREKLVKKYGVGIIKPKGPIPEHIYKKVQAEIWNGDSLFSESYKAYDYSDFGTEDYPIKKMFEIAENFYQSLGFDHLTEEFWNERFSEEANFPCTAEVSDSFTNVKVKYCTYSSFKAFRDTHWHMGQVHAASLKKSLTPYFYNGYSLEDAIGQTIQLAAATPKHLNDTGIFANVITSDEQITTYNFQMAIDFLLNIPYYYTEIKLFTAILNDKIKKEEYNTYYWKVLEEHGGIEPPFDRSESSLDLPFTFYKDFVENKNILGKFHSNILAFQFYRAACQLNGHVGFLHNCDFYNSTEIGEIFKKILSQGSSKPFSEVISLLLPKSAKLDASAILDYFEPVISTLKKKNFSYIGWEHTTHQFTDEVDFTDDDIDKFMTESSKKIYELHDQIAKDLFDNKQDSEEFLNEDGENSFWKVSASGSATVELKEIAKRAQKFNNYELENKTRAKAVEELSKTGDVFVIGEEMDNFMKRKEYLLNMTIDKDVLRYKADPEADDYVSYFPDIINVFLNGTDTEELKYYWEKWRLKNAEFSNYLFTSSIETFKQASDLLGISVTDFWFKHVNSDFMDKMEEVINKLKPFYAKLHFYVRQRLYDQYSDADFTTYSIIPDHLLEQVLLQVWNNNSIVEKNFMWKNLPITNKHIESKEFDAVKLLRTADEFYQSLGFSALDDDFWANRLKPQSGAESHIDCHATIYDWTPKVYMKYCEKVNYKKLLQSISYFGRIHYAKEKHELPAYFFDSYFLEYPVGEAVLLSASTPKYSQSIGLTPDAEITDEVHLNRLIRMAIHTIFNIHKYFVNTKIVYEILDGSIYDEKDITKRYWQLMIKYAGIEPPYDRKEDDFDFPYKFYFDLEQNYQMKKFFSDVLGYQFYEALCKISGHKGDLSTCNFYGSKEAGEKLKEMMHLGSTKPLKTVLKVLLGKRSEISANALLNYYAPVEEWLDKTFDIEDIPNFGSSSRKFWRSEEILE